MEAMINDFISSELVSKPELLPLKNSTLLIETGILDSLTLLQFTLFVEEKFGIIVAPEDLIPTNFESVDAICAFLRRQLQRL